jgi:oxalate decarboxylase
MKTTHLFKFSKIKPQEVAEGGSRKKATKENFPLLSGMSLYKLTLNPNGLREPHWHANADELGYCLQGSGLVSFYDTNDNKQTFTIDPGQAFFIPSGALHYIENIGKGSLEMILCFSDDQPKDFGLCQTMNAFSNNVLANTWNVPASQFSQFKRCDKDTFAKIRSSPLIFTEDARYANPYRYNLEGSQPILEVGGGSARMARKNYWPILQTQALYSLRLTKSGMREPHWHPQTGELGFVEKGKGRMTILSPDGQIDTYIMEEGDIYFIPKAYPHHIENLTDSDLHLLIFFDQPMPKDIGFTGSIRSISDQSLGVTTENKPEFFEKLNKYYLDLFIVDRINLLD